jgi:hypothetical protein
MSKHTPGPWTAMKAQIGSAIVIYDKAMFPIATTPSNSTPVGYEKVKDGTTAANAALIAAAPDLLAALDCALRAFEITQGRAVYPADHWSQQARAAIAKALG